MIEPLLLTGDAAARFYRGMRDRMASDASMEVVARRAARQDDKRWGPIMTTAVAIAVDAATFALRAAGLEDLAARSAAWTDSAAARLAEANYADDRYANIQFALERRIKYAAAVPPEWRTALAAADAAGDAIGAASYWTVGPSYVERYETDGSSMGEKIPVGTTVYSYDRGMALAACARACGAARRLGGDFPSRDDVMERARRILAAL